MKLKFIWILVVIFCFSNTHAQVEKSKKTKMTTTKEIATFANGCFWCTEAIFQRLKGVESVTSGYTGGTLKNPTYQEINTGRTGHAEGIQIVFNPTVITFSEILEVFFSTHDPTTLNRQGYDVGTQYRSAIFYHSQDQFNSASKYIKELNAAKVFDNPIVTEISPFVKFYIAEDYHQNYYNDNKNQPYCQAVINPKLAKFFKDYGHKLKDNLK